MKAVLPPLLVSTSFYDPTDPESFRSINLGLLENPIELSDTEKVLSFYLKNVKPETAIENLNISEEKFDEMYQRIILKNVQDTAKFIHFVDQDENDWSRYIFNENGTLKPGQATSLIYELFKDDASGMSPSEQIYKGRKIQVIAAYLNQEKTFGGHDMDSVAYAAGILDEAGNLKVDGAFLTALTFYTSDAVQNKDTNKIKILEDLCTQLKWRYLKAGPYSREPIGDALRVLGLEPSQTVDEKTFEGQMCFSKDSPQYLLNQLSKKYSNKLSGYYRLKQ